MGEGSATRRLVDEYTKVGGRVGVDVADCVCGWCRHQRLWCAALLLQLQSYASLSPPPAPPRHPLLQGSDGTYVQSRQGVEFSQYMRENGYHIIPIKPKHQLVGGGVGTGAGLARPGLVACLVAAVPPRPPRLPHPSTASHSPPPSHPAGVWLQLPQPGRRAHHLGAHGDGAPDRAVAPLFRRRAVHRLQPHHLHVRRGALLLAGRQARAAPLLRPRPSGSAARRRACTSAVHPTPRVPSMTDLPGYSVCHTLAVCPPSVNLQTFARGEGGGSSSSHPV